MREAIGQDAFDVAVVGAGPAGIAAALALTHLGARVALIGPPPVKMTDSRAETRTAALLTSSVDLLMHLGVWTALAPQAAPLKAIHIVDASRSLFRSPEIAFNAGEIGLEAFGYNIENSKLNETLYARAQHLVAEVIPHSVESIGIGKREVRLKLEGGMSVVAGLLAGADGRRSICRAAAGIETSTWHYNQSAIATSFRHSAAHNGISTELHKEAGSLTSVPMRDSHQSALIWIAPTAEIEALVACVDEQFIAHLQEWFGSILGSVTHAGPRASFPVAGLNAKSLASNRTALVGEAAHIMPPIGAQGLNLGLRDAAELADCVARAVRHGHDTGGPEVLATYAQARKLDVMSRAVGVNFLSRSLLSGFLPVQIARGLLVTGLNTFAPLRRLVMRVGLGPPSDLPTLMRPSETPVHLSA